MVTHLDDVEPVVSDRGELGGTRWRIGAAAGTQRIGLSRYRIAPGRRLMPVHAHADEEEIFYVLAGSGLSWIDGATYALAPGDCVVHHAGGPPHTILGGDSELDVLAYASGSDSSLTWLPRPNVMWAGGRWLPLDGPNPFTAEVEVGPLDVPPPQAARPAEIVAHDAIEAVAWGRGDVAVTLTDYGSAAGSRRSGLQHIAVTPGMLSGPPHCHSAEEELFVVLDGDGELELGDRRLAVRPGSVVGRPPGTGVAHAFRAGASGLALLGYGTHVPDDVTWYQRSNKVRLRGVDVNFRVEPVDYWDGEA